MKRNTLVLLVGTLSLLVGGAGIAAAADQQVAGQEAASSQVFNQRREGAVEDRAAMVTQHGEIVAVSIPRAVRPRHRAGWQR